MTGRSTGDLSSEYVEGQASKFRALSLTNDQRDNDKFATRNKSATVVCNYKSPHDQIISALEVDDILF